MFALSNPNPEIDYNLARKTRKDAILATGRSDHPNQVNNVLGFPYISSGALDVRATEINEAMKLAAVHALAELAKEPVPDIVVKAYGTDKIAIRSRIPYTQAAGPTTSSLRFLLPLQKLPWTPVLPNTLLPTGARITHELQKRIGIDQKLMSRIIDRAKKNPKRVVFAEANHHKILKAAQILERRRHCESNPVR